MLIGVDLGGTAIKAGLVDYNGSILIQNSKPTNISRGEASIIGDIKQQIEELLIVQGITIDDIHSIGIGVPGLAVYETGKVIYCTNLLWKNVELGKELSAYFNKKVFVENDANVAALAESLFGSTRGVPNSVLLTLGTGIGGGIIVNKRIYSGSHSAGSEIGHMIIGENFYDCNCGNNGCFETLASATAIIKYVLHKLQVNNVKSYVLELAGNDTGAVNAKIIFDAAKAGDDLAIEAVERMCKYLAIGIVNIYNILDPDIISIGGGVSTAGDFLLDKVKERVAKMLFASGIKYGEIVLAALGNEAGIVGSAFLGYNNNSLD